MIVASALSTKILYKREKKPSLQNKQFFLRPKYKKKSLQCCVFWCIILHFPVKITSSKEISKYLKEEKYISGLCQH